MTERCYGYVDPWCYTDFPACGACHSPPAGRGWEGRLSWPLPTRDVHLGRGFRLGHPALDFDAPVGMSVKASGTGVVVWAGKSQYGYGNLVILDHGSGYQTLYAHLEGVAVGCGWTVAEGTVLGTVGMTGQSSFPHLHFEVRENRLSCNPYLWLADAEPPPPDEPEEDVMSELLNPDFEMDWSVEQSHRCVIFPKDNLPYERDVGNIFNPPHWRCWFRHDAGTWDQPEVRDAWKQNDPHRVHSGEKAILLFTFHRRHDAGFLQRVSVTPGKRYKLSAWCHAWSNHELAGHEDCYEDGRCSCGVGREAAFIWEGDAPPLTGDQWNDAKQNFLFTVGLDPAGGNDPFAASVVWGRAAHVYNEHGQLIVEAEATGDTMTVFLRSITQWAFKHNDSYWDDVTFEEVDEVSDERGKPRIDYKRTYVLLPPEADAAWARAVVDGAWDEKRYTIGGSADDSGIGDLSDRNVIAVNPDGWGSDLAAFFETYYPGVNYTALVAATPDELREKLSGPFEPGPPGPTPPLARTTRGHIGLHLQTMVPGWRALLLQERDDVRTLLREAGGFMTTVHPPVCKVLASMEDVKGLARACPDTVRVWRHVENSLGGIFPNPDAHQGARRWIGMFRDGLYQLCDEMAQEFPHLPEPYCYVESPNEIYNSDYEIVRQAAALDLAFCEELMALDLPIRPAVFSAAVGNPHHLGGQYELLVPMARVCEEVGGLFGYHAYWLANPDYGGPDHLWKYLAGRWTEIDDVLRAHGVHVRWFFGECGGVGGTSGHHPDGTGWVNLNAGSGWKDGECYAGDWNRYLRDLMRWDELVAEWNVTHEDRAIGGTIFTSGAPYCGWAEFQVQETELRAIAAAILERYGV